MLHEFARCLAQGPCQPVYHSGFSAGTCASQETTPQRLNLQSTTWNVFYIVTHESTHVTGTKFYFVILAIFYAVHLIFLLYFISVFKNNSSPRLLNRLSGLQYWSRNPDRWEIGAQRCAEYQAQCLEDSNPKCLCLIFLVTQHTWVAPHGGAGTEPRFPNS